MFYSTKTLLVIPRTKAANLFKSSFVIPENGRQQGRRGYAWRVPRGLSRRSRDHDEHHRFGDGLLTRSPTNLHPLDLNLRRILRTARNKFFYPRRVPTFQIVTESQWGWIWNENEYILLTFEVLMFVTGSVVQRSCSKVNLKKKKFLI